MSVSNRYLSEMLRQSFSKKYQNNQISLNMIEQGIEINLSCSRNNKAAYITTDFRTPFCEDRSCRCFSQRGEVYSIKELRRMIKEKENRGWGGYGKLVEFYNNTIKALEVDRAILVNKIKTEKGPGLYRVQKKMIDFLAAGKLNEMEYGQKQLLVELFKPGGHQQRLKDMIAQISTEFVKICTNARSAWFKDSLLGIDEQSKALGFIKQKYLMGKWRYCKSIINDGGKEYSMLHAQSLAGLRSIQIQEQYFSELSSLKYLAPNLSQISFRNHSIRTLNLRQIPIFQGITSLSMYFDHQLQQLSLKFPNLKQLFAKVNCSESQRRFLDGFQSLKNLTHLRIQSNKNSMEVESEAFAIQSQNLEFLSLQTALKTSESSLEHFRNSKLQTLVIKEFSQSIFSFISAFRSLHHLNIAEINIGNGGALCLKDCISLKTLHANKCNIGDIGILNFISHLHNLEVLDLSTGAHSDKESYITSVGMKAICQNNPHITHLKLNNQPIGNQGALIIQRYLKSLQVLLMINCQIGQSGTRYISKIKSLRELEIGCEIAVRGFHLINNQKHLCKLRIQSKKVFVSQSFRALRNQNILLERTAINEKETQTLKPDNFDYFDLPKIIVNVSGIYPDPSNLRYDIVEVEPVPIVDFPRIMEVKVVRQVAIEQAVYVPVDPVPQRREEITIVEVQRTTDVIVEVPRFVEAAPTIIQRVVEIPHIIQNIVEVPVLNQVQRVLEVPIQQMIVERIVEIPRIYERMPRVTSCGVRKMPNLKNKYKHTNELNSQCWRY